MSPCPTVSLAGCEGARALHTCASPPPAQVQLRARAREPRGLCTSQEGALRWGEDENKDASPWETGPCCGAGAAVSSVLRILPLSPPCCARGAEAPRSRAGGLGAGARQRRCGERWQCLKSPDCCTQRRGSPQFLAFRCISLSLPRPQLTALPTLGAGRLPRYHSSAGIAPARTYAVVFPCPVPSPNSHRADRCGARAAFRWAPAGATCGSCCSREPLFAAVCPRCLINPHPPHDLRPLAAMLSSGSKASELGKLWEQ